MRQWWLWLGLCGVWLGCGVGGEGRAVLTVSAAASLTESFEELGRQFSARPGAPGLRFQFGASGDLARQIKGGAPVDVFASAAAGPMEELVSAGRVDGATVANVARNRLVLVAAAGVGMAPGPVEAVLGDARVARVALGESKLVPAGEYAEQALRALGLWEGLSAKVVRGANVRQVLDLVARREADLGVVYATDIQGRGDVVMLAEVPSAGPIVYPIGVVVGGEQTEAAREFVRFVTGPEGRAVLTARGFGAP